MKFRMLPAAYEELDEAARWYGSREAGLAARFLEQVAEAWRRIQSNPEQFEVCGKVGDHEYRRARVSDFPYDVIFEVRGNVLRVIAMDHHKRQYKSWKTRS
jgi:plasmid stabilization system protein ParE